MNTAVTKQAHVMLPADPRAAWELWKWMQNVSDRLWNIHASKFMDFDEEEHRSFLSSKK